MARPFVHIPAKGEKFGKWTVLCDLTARWGVRCECGFETFVRRDFIMRGKSRACESCAQKKHGKEGSATYNVWAGMIQRCCNSNSAGFAWYGGRGITVCDAWRNSFEAFFADMGEKPKGKTLDRKNNDGPYSPGNCRWATHKQQIRNRTISPKVMFNGAERSLGDLAEEFKIPRKLLYARVKAGWPINDALTRRASKLNRI